MLLKAKIVKSGHGRHYIKDPCRAQEEEKKITNIVIGTSRRITAKISKTLRKKKEKKEELERKNRKRRA